MEKSEFVIEIAGLDKASEVLADVNGAAARWEAILARREARSRRPLWRALLTHGIVAVVAVLLALLLWAGTARALVQEMGAPEYETLAWGRIDPPVLTVSAAGDVTILDWHVGPRALALRMALVMHDDCSPGLTMDFVWLLWDSLIDEAGRSARTWGEG